MLVENVKSSIVRSRLGRRLVAFEVSEEGAHPAAQLVSALLVSGNYFQVLGITPAV